MKRQGMTSVVIFVATLLALSISAIPACDGGGDDNGDGDGGCTSGYVGKERWGGGADNTAITAWYETKTNKSFGQAKLIDPVGIEYGMSVGTTGWGDRYASYLDYLVVYPAGLYKIVIDGKVVLSEIVPSLKPVQPQFISPAPGGNFSVSNPPSIQWHYPTPAAGETLPDYVHMQVYYGSTMIKQSQIPATQTSYQVPTGLTAGQTLSITLWTFVGDYRIMPSECGQKEAYWSDYNGSTFSGVP